MTMTRKRIRPYPAECVQRRLQRRKAHGRCPRCHKIRKLWMRDNEWHGWRGGRISSMNVPGEGKVCWICRIREVDPDWHPGLPQPDIISNRTKFKP